jgi:multidrug efflux pump subunit AcrA (membrane-fusion protein)
LEQSLPGNKQAREIARAELINLESTTPSTLESAERGRRRADEDYSYFASVDRAEREKAIELSVKSAEERLANAQEELDQLLKMYKADDLTEETEEIILKRQKFSVESSEYFLENAKRNAKRGLEVTIPREGENLKSQKQEQELAWELSRVTLPRGFEQKRLTVDKLETEQTESEEKLADLKSDRNLLVVRAPRSGFVYYGDNEFGKWSTGAALVKKLVPSGKLAPREVFMTIVDPDDLVIKAVVPENKLARLETGIRGEASPVSNPDVKLPVKLEELSYIALPSGGFLATLSMKKRGRDRIMPGMSCNVVFGDIEKEDILIVPKTAVFKDAGNSFVYMDSEESSPEKREVETGEQDDRMIEIKRGLKSGDKILLKKPN